MVIVLREHQFERANSLDLHAGVCWHRVKDRGETIHLRARDGMPRWVSGLKWKMESQTIEVWLAALFGMPEILPDLVKWFAETDNPVSLPEPVEPTPMKRGPQKKPLHDPATVQAGFEIAQGEPYDQVVNRLKQRQQQVKPSSNGKH
jgi:hypothetical protein